MTASAGAFVPAHAADTTTTFTIANAGGLSISAPADADLGTVSSGALLVQGGLGTVSVTDQRGLLEGSWTATASSTDFVYEDPQGAAAPDQDVARAQAAYSAGLSSGGGLGVSVGAGGSLALPVVAATRVGVGNNAGSWNPTIAVTLSPQAPIGTYTATITHSVS